MRGELATYVVFMTIDIEPFFLTKNKKKRKKNIEETYDVVL